MSTTFYASRNFAGSALATDHVSGDNLLNVTDVSVFGTPSSGSPIRVCVGTGSNSVIFAVNNISDSSLVISGVLEGTTDANLGAGSPVEMRVTAGTLSDIHVAVNGVENSKAPLASPSLTGVPTAPTATTGTNTTQIATTAFVASAVTGISIGSEVGGSPVSGGLMYADASGDLKNDGPTWSPTTPLEIRKLPAANTARLEILRISRTGNTDALVGRAGLISFYDGNNTTLVGAVGGYREDAGNNWYGGLNFYVNATNSPASSVGDLTQAFSIGPSGNIGIAGHLGVGTVASTQNNAQVEVSVSPSTGTARAEILRLSRVGNSGGDTSGRAAYMTYWDANNGTLVAAVGGTRDDSSLNYAGGLSFLVNSSGTSQAAISGLTESARIDSSGAFHVSVSSTSAVPFTADGAAGQSVNLIECTVNGGSPVFSVNHSGNVTAQGITIPVSPSSGYVLTSDSSGNGTWQATTLPTPGSVTGNTIGGSTEASLVSALAANGYVVNSTGNVSAVTISGSRSDGTALEQLLTFLSALGWLTDSSTS